MELTKEEIIDWESKRLPDLYIKEGSEIEMVDVFKDRIKKYDFYTMMNGSNIDTNHRKTGHFFLYEKVICENGFWIISYPRLGMYLHEFFIDMATEVEWIDVRRSYEYRIEIENSDYLHNFRRTEIQSLINWSDRLLVYGAWDHNPNWKELRKSWSNTIHAYEPIDIIRSRKLNSLLK
jgi:hypothetical protein